MDIIIITGPPYSGKGTQCDFLKEIFDYEHISTGSRCRTEKLNKTKIGLTMSQYEEKGDLVPDHIMKELFGNILDENKDKKGVILDGYPRTIAQVDDLLEIVKDRNLKIGTVINIEVPEKELLKRAEKKALTSSRKDDKDKKIHLKRIQVFEDITKPAIVYMQSKLKVENFDGLGSIEDITQTIKSRIIN